MNIFIFDIFNLIFRQIEFSVKDAFLIIDKCVKTKMQSDDKCFLVYDPQPKNINTVYGQVNQRKDPNYKANRKDKEKLDLSDVRNLQALVHYSYKDNSNVVQIQSIEDEADDIAASIVKKYQGENVHFNLISTDQDWLAMMDKNVVLFNKDPFSNGLTYEDANEKYGFYPTNEKMAFYKACFGDSDNIQGAMRNRSLKNTLEFREKCVIDYLNWEGCDPRKDIQEYIKSEIAYYGIDTLREKNPKEAMFFMFYEFYYKNSFQMKLKNNYEILERKTNIEFEKLLACPISPELEKVIYDWTFNKKPTKPISFSPIRVKQ